MRALIITGGEVDIAFEMKESYQLIIAVDGGLAYAREMNITPDVVIGDFDTVSEEVLQQFQNSKIIRLNTQKDDTDTQAAVTYAIEQGITGITMLGATGTRFDHTFANMFLLKMCYDKGIEMTYYTPLSKIYLISNQKIYKKNDFFGKYISFLPFDGAALGVTLKGFQYELSDFDLDTGKNYRLAVSNEAGEGDACVTIEKGYLLVVESQEDKG